MVPASQQQYQYFHPQQVQQPAQYYTTPTQIDPNGMVITNTQMLPPHSQIPQAPPTQTMTAQQQQQQATATAQQQTTPSSPRQHISPQQQPNTPTSMTSSPSVPVQTVPKPAQVNPTQLPTQTTPIGQIQNPVMLIPGLPSIGKICSLRVASSAQDFKWRLRSIRFDFDLFLTLENCAPYELSKRI